LFGRSCHQKHNSQGEELIDIQLRDGLFWIQPKFSAWTEPSQYYSTDEKEIDDKTNQWLVLKTMIENTHVKVPKAVVN
jgi:hypothetical protein